VTALEREGKFGLDDAINLAMNKSQLLTNISEVGDYFGAAGRKGHVVDEELQSILSPILGPSRATSFSSDRGFWFEGTGALEPVLNSTLRRMFLSGLIPPESIRYDSNPSIYSHAIMELRRFSAEVVALALHLSDQVKKNDRILFKADDASGPPVIMLLSSAVDYVSESRVISEEANLPLSLLIEAFDFIMKERDDAVFESITREGKPAALARLFFSVRPEIILTRRPRMIPLCTPAPHISLKSDGKISTAGLLCRDADGALGVTACYHGTGPVGTHVMVDLRECEVTRADKVQDIVFIPLGEGFNIPDLVGLRGVESNSEPSRSARVRFDGATNQNKATRILSTDFGLLRARPTVQLKVQTDPDTDQGDSGSALLDDNDRVLGFAFERTAYDDYPQFTDWIWAANALRALQLTPIK